RGVARGEIRRADPAAAALAIFDLTRGLVARGIVAARALDVESEVAFVTSLVWTGLQKEKAPAARSRHKSPERAHLRDRREKQTRDRGKA
ncbi:MAG: hypothetical protein ACJ731_06850, partial [Vicinamibacterales bacterium]